MTPDIDPLVGAAHDVGIGFEAAQRLDGVHLLHAERLAVADQGGGILPVVHILGQHGHVARTHGDRAAEYFITLGGRELRKAGDTFGVPFSTLICGIFHLHRVF